MKNITSETHVLRQAWFDANRRYDEAHAEVCKEDERLSHLKNRLEEVLLQYPHAHFLDPKQADPSTHFGELTKRYAWLKRMELAVISEHKELFLLLVDTSDKHAEYDFHWDNLEELKEVPDDASEA